MEQNEVLILVLLLVCSMLVGFLARGLRRSWVKKELGTSPVRLLVITHNVEDLIEGWLRLVIGDWSRRMPVPWDIMVVDTGSTDATWDIIERLSQEKGMRVMSSPMPEGDGSHWATPDPGKVTVVVPLGNADRARSHLATLLGMADNLRNGGFAARPML